MNQVLVILLLLVVPLLAQATEPVFAWVNKTSVNRQETPMTRHPCPSEKDRPHLVTFKECRNIRVSGVTLMGGASWANTYYTCQNVLIDHLKIESRTFWNNDG